MPDVRLIDAGSTKEKLGFAIEPFIGSAADEIRNDTLLDAIKIVDSMPTVDAQPVKRGKWISEKVQKKDWKGIERSYFQPNSCSVCHIGVAVRTKFCPNCGSKMKDGG